MTHGALVPSSDGPIIVVDQGMALRDSDAVLASEWEEDERFHFDVPIALPLIGRIVHYRGWLKQ